MPGGGIPLPDDGILRAIGRVMEVCETMAGPEQRRPSCVIEFPDGSVETLSQVLAHGRLALVSLAQKFGPQEASLEVVEEAAHG